MSKFLLSFESIVMCRLSVVTSLLALYIKFLSSF